DSIEKGNFGKAADDLGELCYALVLDDENLDEEQSRKIESFAAIVFDECYDNDEIDFLPLIIGDLCEYKNGLLNKAIIENMKPETLENAEWIKTNLLCN
ncbi:MAG: hypothetical protein KAI79_10285, partial [Bacteroidales bacterium]|nr:hypothetical protein [Bacteroidales bacterium]